MRPTIILLMLVALSGSAVAQYADRAAAPRIPMAEFKTLYAQHKVLVVDVRDAAAFAAGHIPGARSIPLATLLDSQRLAELKAETREIVLYCA